MGNCWFTPHYLAVKHNIYDMRKLMTLRFHFIKEWTNTRTALRILRGQPLFGEANSKIRSGFAQALAKCLENSWFYTYCMDNHSISWLRVQQSFMFTWCGNSYVYYVDLADVEDHNSIAKKTQWQEWKCQLKESKTAWSCGTHHKYRPFRYFPSK